MYGSVAEGGGRSAASGLWLGLEARVCVCGGGVYEGGGRSAASRLWLEGLWLGLQLQLGLALGSCANEHGSIEFAAQTC